MVGWKCSALKVTPSIAIPLRRSRHPPVGQGPLVAAEGLHEEAVEGQQEDCPLLAAVGHEVAGLADDGADWRPVGAGRLDEMVGRRRVALDPVHPPPPPAAEVGPEQGIGPVPVGQGMIPADERRALHVGQADDRRPRQVIDRDSSGADRRRGEPRAMRGRHREVGIDQRHQADLPEGLAVSVLAGRLGPPDLLWLGDVIVVVVAPGEEDEGRVLASSRGG